jgi:hypothetical protein
MVEADDPGAFQQVEHDGNPPRDGDPVGPAFMAPDGRTWPLPLAPVAPTVQSDPRQPFSSVIFRHVVWPDGRTQVRVRSCDARAKAV